jgi:hypothetical protein
LSLLGTAITVWSIVPASDDADDDDDCGTVGGMRIGRGTRTTRRNPVPVSLCPPKIPNFSHSEGWSPNWVHSARWPVLACCTCTG